MTISLNLAVPATFNDDGGDNANNNVVGAIPDKISNDIDFTQATRNADGKLCVFKGCLILE